MATRLATTVTYNVRNHIEAVIAMLTGTILAITRCVVAIVPAVHTANVAVSIDRERIAPRDSACEFDGCQLRATGA
jgi:cytochrome c biogenesis protein CcdA